MQTEKRISLSMIDSGLCTSWAQLQPGYFCKHQSEGVIRWNLKEKNEMTLQLFIGSSSSVWEVAKKIAWGFLFIYLFSRGRWKLVSWAHGTWEPLLNSEWKMVSKVGDTPWKDEKKWKQTAYVCYDSEEITLSPCSVTDLCDLGQVT